MREGTATLVRRVDYAPPAHWIRSVDLSFELDPAKTLVINRMRIEPNADLPAQPLRLHGEELNLTRVLVNGTSVSFRHEDGMLVIDQPPDAAFDLEIRNTCAPAKNTQLSGLYSSGGGFFTQCEAEGFRRITYFADRPDVMAVYTVTLRANKASYPVLLSNGNLVETGDLEGGRHYAKWHDPFPKPSYLFALVAADLVAREQRIRSRSGRDHLLQIYVRRGDLEKTEHANKTGTLTEGEPKLVDIRLAGDGKNESDVAHALEIARALERDSEHPIARALRRVRPGERMRPAGRVLEAVRTYPGLGVEGTLAGRSYRIGRPEWALAPEVIVCVADGGAEAHGLRESGGPSGTGVLHAGERETRASQVSVLLSCDRTPLAWLDFEDPIRVEAEPTMLELRAAGMSLEMLSGDPSPGAADVARALGLEVKVFGALPDQKVERVQALARAGYRVVVVGDGVNDGPVLRAGDVSIAMGSGCDLSRLGASAVLLRDDLGLLPRALSAARRMRRIGVQNVAWAIGYNLAVLPLAVSGHLPPWLAALGMSTSSLVVVLNALRGNRLPSEGAR